MAHLTIVTKRYCQRVCSNPSCIELTDLTQSCSAKTSGEVSRVFSSARYYSFLLVVVVVVVLILFLAVFSEVSPTSDTTERHNCSTARERTHLKVFRVFFFVKLLAEIIDKTRAAS
jgi:hypothetical protein